MSPSGSRGPDGSLPSPLPSSDATPGDVLDIDTVPAAAFALADELTPGGGHWHSHTRHQLLYAARGVLRLEVQGGRWVLPSARAAWIRAGVAHRVDVSMPASLRTVYFAVDAVPSAVDALGECRVFAVSDLCRELILYGMRWGPTRDPGDARAERFFAVLGDCCVDWIEAIRPFRLPRARSPELATAMIYARHHLDEADVQRAAEAAGISTRTLGRRFRSETGMSWRQWLRTARILRAMELLAEGSSVTDTALVVGFDSPAAFSHAFGDMVGEPPSVFARHIRPEA